MISSLSRHLPRTTASSVASFKCIRPTVCSSPILTSSRAFSSSDANDDKALSRDAIGEIISAEYGLSMAESKRVVRTVFDTVTESITKKQSVNIAGFGKFSAVDIPARVYTNPQNPTGPRISKPATTRVKFQPFKHFKDCVAEGKFEK